MEQDKYLELLKCGDLMSEIEAKAYINREFGFEFSCIKIFNRIEGQVMREPVYCSTDWNYVRFDASNWHYECVNGQLKFYYC